MDNITFRATESQDPADYIPWSWHVQPLDSLGQPDLDQCPSPTSILATFAIINAVVACISILLGHRKVTRFLTCTMFGRRDSRSWMVMWIFIVGLQLAANALVAFIIQKTPGYGEGFHVWQLMLFFAARPRISWIIAIPFSFFKGKGKNTQVGSWYDDYQQVPSSQIPMVDYPYSNFLHPQYGNGDYVYGSPSSSAHMSRSSQALQRQQSSRYDYIWRNFAFSQFIAEIFLQFITAYTMGTTVKFAVDRGYYILGHLKGRVGKDAHMMYAAALYWICGQSVLLLAGLLVAAYAFFASDTAKWMHRSMTVMGLLMLPTSWLATWLFWAGFVKLASHEYCPPKLAVQAVVWSVFSSIGVFLGVGP